MRKRILTRLILAIVLMLPLLLCRHSLAESGCHKGGGNPPRAEIPGR